MIKLRKMILGNRGSVAVEFALFMPVLLMLIMGIIELGSAWYSKQMMVSASREGARMAALYSDTTNTQVEQEVQTLLTQAGFPGSATIASTGAGGSPGDLVTVQITTNHPLSVLGGLVPGLPQAITLTASTVMRHE